MRKLLMVLLFAVITQISTAQISNTTWKGIFKVPDPTEMVLQFKADTLLVNTTDDDETVEAMKYTIKNDTISIIKIFGESDCSGDSLAICKILIKDDKLYISSIKDDCPQRADAWPEEGMIRLK